MAEQAGMNVVVVGLGYVGLPLAVALARQLRRRPASTSTRAAIEELGRGIDRTREVEPEALAASPLRLTSRAADCAGADIYIVTVPTPVDARQPARSRAR